MSVGQVGKATAVIEARVDVRDLATFAKFLLANGGIIKSRSDLVWQAFRSITESLASTGVDPFQSTEDAYAYMQGLGIGSTNRAGRAGRKMNTFTLAKTIEAEAGIAGNTTPGAMVSLDELAIIARRIKEGS